MPSEVTFSTIDHSSEKSRSSLYVETLDDTNYDELLDPITGKVTLLQAAFDLLTDCNRTKTGFSFVSDVGNPATPATETAQREIAVKLSYADTVNGRAGSMTVPGPKTGLYPGAGSDVVPLDNVVAAAFIAVFEANALSRDGNPVTVTQIRLIGRAS